MKTPQPKLPFIEAIVRVSDDSFETRLTIPVTATKEQLQNIGEMWMSALLKSLQAAGGTS